MVEPVKSEDDLLRAVWHGAMSIEDGVAWGLEHGYPFTALPASEIAAFKNAAWTIEQAIGWIAWRTDEEAARASALLRYWGSSLLDLAPDNEQRESLSDAKTLLWNSLIGGTVPATGIVGPRSMKSMTMPRVLIPATDFIDLEWAIAGLSRHVLQPDKQWIEVRVPAAIVRVMWPGDVGNRSSAPAGSSGDRDGTKVGTAVRALMELYPHRPPSKNRAHLRKQIEERIGYAVSLATLDRAWNKAWK